ncbi:hypothetical protein CONPUDRAFT_77044 [Coniophora puteana RWD-64-598 SS2]|uniref:Uncharacterized protein n=1 Tax=Coniophora puteana (strain RWD-64-598) TaxID=741705 RepID=A0A5M3MA96_CONPW|nr:uncharacterized protein CONPUDRAFT_77044 [Coniophora puteana RWD-64-598 SS2]EIW76027.1 hypothetical protein CONPUDRAFT_77044 [Coniophora puteana RWD-64-598 SS2]
MSSAAGNQNVNNSALEHPASATRLSDLPIPVHPSAIEDTARPSQDTPADSVQPSFTPAIDRPPFTRAQSAPVNIMSPKIALPLDKDKVRITFAEPIPVTILPGMGHPSHPRRFSDLPYRRERTPVPEPARSETQLISVLWELMEQRKREEALAQATVKAEPSDEDTTLIITEADRLKIVKDLQSARPLNEPAAPQESSPLHLPFNINELSSAHEDSEDSHNNSTGSHTSSDLDNHPYPFRNGPLPPSHSSPSPVRLHAASSLHFSLLAASTPSPPAALPHAGPSQAGVSGSMPASSPLKRKSLLCRRSELALFAHYLLSFTSTGANMASGLPPNFPSPKHIYDSSVHAHAWSMSDMSQLSYYQMPTGNSRWSNPSDGYGGPSMQQHMVLLQDKCNTLEHDLAAIRNEHAVLKNEKAMLQQCYDHLADSVGLKRGHLLVDEVPNIVNHEEHLADMKKHYKVNYWMEKKFTDERKDYDNGTTPFCKYSDGKKVPRETIDVVRETLRTLWWQFASQKRLALVWTAHSFDVKEETHCAMYSKYPWLALAEDNWKVNYLGKDSFPNFKRSYLDNLENIRPKILAKMEDNPKAAEAILKDSKSTSASNEATISTKCTKGKGKEKENDPAPPPPPSPKAISDQGNLDDPNPVGVGAEEVTRQDNPVIKCEDALAIDPTDCTCISNVERDDIPENRDEEVFEPCTFPSDSPDANEEGSCELSPLPWLEKERAEREQSECAATTNACASGLPTDHAAASRQKVATPTEPGPTAAPAPSQDVEQGLLPCMLPVLKFKLSKKAIPVVASEEATNEQDSQVHTSSISTPPSASPPVTKTTRSTARKSAAATTPSKSPPQVFKSRAQAVLENPSEYTKNSRLQSRKEGFSEPISGVFDHKPEAGASGQHKEEDAAKEAFDPGDKKDGRYTLRGLSTRVFILTSFCMMHKTLCAIWWLEKEKNKGSLKKKYTAEAKKLVTEGGYGLAGQHFGLGMISGLFLLSQSHRCRCLQQNGQFKPTYYSQLHVRFCRMMHLYATKWSAYTRLLQTAASAGICVCIDQAWHVILLH